MKKQIWLLALASAVLLSVAPAWAQEFYVIAGGGVGTRISSLPYTITSPGFYYLAGNLSATSGNGINVNSDDVTIDLMGFRLSGPGATSNLIGIFMNGRKNVEIRNGTLSGCQACIFEGAAAGLGHRVSNMRVESAGIGIELFGSGHLIKGCTALDCAGFGIGFQGTASGNVVTNCGTGISTLGGGGVVIGNTVMTTAATQTGITTGGVIPTLVTQNAVTGPGTRFVTGPGTVNVANTNAGF
jgi:hypothetical protein